MTLLRAFVVVCQKMSVMLGMIGVLLVANPALADTPPDIDGATLFEVQCAGCHPQGGNIIRRRQTLKLKSLERDGYNTPDSLAEIVTNGYKNMPEFGDKLDSSEIKTISQFVLDQANKGW